VGINTTTINNNRNNNNKREDGTDAEKITEQSTLWLLKGSKVADESNEDKEEIDNQDKQVDQKRLTKKSMLKHPATTTITANRTANDYEGR
jgi:hypothetical protein